LYQVFHRRRSRFTATVTARFQDVWGVAPAVGRGFTPDEHWSPTRAALVEPMRTLREE
jgi:hypothetical protein